MKIKPLNIAILIILVISTLSISSCSCRWAAKNCANIIITDTIRESSIHDTTFYDTTFIPVPSEIIKIRALALIDEMGFVQMPETSITNNAGTKISIKIIRDTVIAEAICKHPDNLLITKHNIRKEYKKLATSNSKTITISEKPKLLTILKFAFIGLLIGIVLTCILIFRNRIKKFIYKYIFQL
jgi:hypothetical protein